MVLNTYLNYGGNCRQAFEFYAANLGGTITMLTPYGEQSGMGTSTPDSKDAVLHARIEIGNAVVFGADVPADRFKPMRSAYLSLSLDSVEETERVYGLLSPDGEIFMAMQETFFAHRFAMLRDKFGTSWMLLYPRPM